MAIMEAEKKLRVLAIKPFINTFYRKQKQGDKLYLKLRRKRKKRLKRLKTVDGRGKIPNKTMIDKRPQIIETEQRVGDWEGNTIIGKDHQGAMLTLVELKSKFTFIFALEAKTAQESDRRCGRRKNNTEPEK